MDATITFDAAGTARALYADAIAPILAALGDPVTRRASDVEPCCDRCTAWTATIRPWVTGLTSGLRLGRFPTREAALAEEVRYLALVL